MIRYHHKSKKFGFKTWKLNRFRHEMSEEIIEACNRELGTYISDLGY